MTHVITVTSQKGGVAKTTTALAIAHGLALHRAEAATILIDFDPQGHAAISLGLDPEPGIFDLFVSRRSPDHLIRRIHERNLWLLPGNSRTRTAEGVLRLEATVAGLVEQFTETVGDLYDYVVIDTPPNGLFQELAVRLAQTIIVPVRCETLGLDGVAATMQVAAQIGQPDRQMIILPTMFDHRLKEHNYNLDLLRRNYPRHVADPVPARVAVAEAVAMGKTVWEHGHGAMQGVRNAYEAVLARIAEVRP